MLEMTKVERQSFIAHIVIQESRENDSKFGDSEKEDFICKFLNRSEYFKDKNGKTDEKALNEYFKRQKIKMQKSFIF